MQTPYAATIRPETGLNNGRFGLYLFLAAEVMFFGALFSSYAFLRAANPNWSEQIAALSPVLSYAQVAVLFLAWIAAIRAQRFLHRGQYETFWFSSVSALVAAGAFVWLAILQLMRLSDASLLPKTSTFIALYYILALVMALHVGAGVLAGLQQITLGRKLQQRSSELYLSRAEGMAVFHGFNTIVWVITMALFVWMR